MSTVKIFIPVKPHVKNYVWSEYGKKVIPLDRPHICIIQNKLLDLLTRPQRFYRYELGSQYTESLSFDLSPWISDTAGIDITPDKVMAFNSFVEMCIRERLFILLDTLREMEEVKIKAVIDTYIDHNNLLEAGIKYDSLKKAYYRYRLSQTDRRKSWQILGELNVPGYARNVV